MMFLIVSHFMSKKEVVAQDRSEPIDGVQQGF